MSHQRPTKTDEAEAIHRERVEKIHEGRFKMPPDDLEAAIHRIGGELRDLVTLLTTDGSSRVSPPIVRSASRLLRGDDLTAGLNAVYTAEHTANGNTDRAGWLYQASSILGRIVAGGVHAPDGAVEALRLIVDSLAPTGKHAPLHDKQLEILKMLARHPSRLFTKTELGNRRTITKYLPTLQRLGFVAGTATGNGERLQITNRGLAAIKPYLPVDMCTQSARD